MKVTVKFIDGKFVKVLFTGYKPSSDSLARFIVWRNETTYTKTEITVSEEDKIYTITVQ